MTTSSTVNTNTIYVVSLCAIILLCFCSQTQSAKHDNVTTGNSLNDRLADYLESPNKKFQMGFFQTQKTSKSFARYIGIWYTDDSKTVVWVGNRDKPVLDSTGYLMVSKDGNAEMLDHEKKVYFNTSIATEGVFQTALMLLDSGNLVLKNVKTGETLWQSFENPTDTFLPGMKMVKNLTLTSWRSPKDPGCGSFKFQADDDPVANTYSILNESKVYWKSGRENIKENRFYENQMFSNALRLLTNTFITRQPKLQYNGTFSNYTMTYENHSIIEDYTRLVISCSGKVQYFSRGPPENKKWVLHWYEPENACSVYRVCGVFGICDSKNKSVLCSCIKGFDDDYKNGCGRTSQICRKSSNDTFVNISMIDMDDAASFYEAENESECMRTCLDGCVCVAYSFTAPEKRGVLWDEGRNVTTHSCSIWKSDHEPYNLRRHGRHNISFRVSSESKGTYVQVATYIIFPCDVDELNDVPFMTPALLL